MPTHSFSPVVVCLALANLFVFGAQAQGYSYYNGTVSNTTTSSTSSSISSTIVVSSSSSTGSSVLDVLTNATISLTTSTTSSSISSSTSDALLNTTSTYIYPNTTATLEYNATVTQLPDNTTASESAGRFANATATYSQWFTQANGTSSRPGPTPPPVRLAPAIPPSINPNSPTVLEPNRTVDLFFQGRRPANGSEIPIASVNIPKMAYPAVVLDHSALIDDIECDLTKLRLKFSHLDALDTAQGTWTMPKFVMMAFNKKCGKASKTGERDYLLVNGLKFDRKRLSVEADIKHIDVVEAVGKNNPITVDMGSYKPGSLNGTVGFDTEGPTIARNGTQTEAKTNPDFDGALDDKLGYTTLSGASVVVKRHAGLDSDVDIHVRGWFSKIVNAVKKVINKVADFLPTWTLTPLNKNIDIALGGGNVYTPFLNKKGYQLYNYNSGPNYVRLYCVDCGVNGVLNVKATVTFNLAGLISSGSFGINGNLRAGLGLGVDANYATTIPAFSKTLVAIPLSPFAIPGLITIGPHLDFGVGASASINAKGNAFAGVYLNWPQVSAQLNLYKAPTAYGFVPTVTPLYSAQGQVTLSASVYATVSLGFGVSILNGLKSFGVALVEKPELYVSGASNNPLCRGFRLSAGLRNTVYADVFGSHYNILFWDGPSTQKCYNLRKRETPLTLPAPISKRAESKQIKAIDGSIALHYADNGNIYALPQVNGSVVDMSTIFFSSSEPGVITGDVESRIFHGYRDTLNSTGVSRLRLSRPDHIPTTAFALTLQNSDTPDYPNVLVALDAAHNVYYPVVCAFGDAAFPRLFLTKNPSDGATALMSDNLVDTITGVKPEVCEFVPFVGV